jgi:hypothetical protein
MFQLADHEKPIDYGSLESLQFSRQFSRCVRKPLPVLQELIRRQEQGEGPDYDMARSVGISRAQVDCLRNTVAKPGTCPGALGRHRAAGQCLL